MSRMSTRTTRSILFGNEDVHPDQFDNLTDEINAAIGFATDPWCAPGTRQRLLSYADECKALLAKATDPPQAEAEPAAIEPRKPLSEYPGISAWLPPSVQGEYEDICRRLEEAHSKLAPIVPAAPPLPDVETLARALFETDERVREHVRRVADYRISTGAGRPSIYDDARFRRAMDIAWERDEQHWATEARMRAPSVLDVLRGRR